jgi:hypothetical protein
VVRLAVRAVVMGVVGSLWVLAAAMFVTGLVLWRDWHRLAREGVDHQAQVEECTFETMSYKRNMGRRRGYYSCHYRYQPAGSTGEHRGYFQSPGEWKPGEAVAIRHGRDDVSVSATVQDLEHPGIAPGAMIALPLLFAGGQAWHRVRRRRRALDIRSAAQ